MHRLATCPGLDPPEDVVLVEQPGADVLFLTSAGTDISCLDASLPSNQDWKERIRALPLSCLEHPAQLDHYLLHLTMLLLDKKAQHCRVQQRRMGVLRY